MPHTNGKQWPHAIKAVIFDMDGLLLDSEQIYRRLNQEICAEWGYHMSVEMYSAFVGIPVRDHVPLYKRLFGPDFNIEDFEQHLERRCNQAFATHIPLKNGAQALVHALSERGIPIAIATSTGAHAHQHLKTAQLHHYFDAIVTRADVENGKPHPEPYRKAAAQLGVDPKYCIAFEDSHNGVRSASAAGTATIMVPDLLPPTDEITSLCTAILPSLEHFHAQLDDFFASRS